MEGIFIVMKELKNVKASIYLKIIALEFTIVMLMSKLAPYLLNYPPNSEQPIFQTIFIVRWIRNNFIYYYY